MFPHISMPVCSTMIMRTFNARSSAGPDDLGVTYARVRGRHVTARKPLQGQTLTGFDGSRAGWETRSLSVASTPHPRPAGGHIVRQCLLQPWRRCSVSSMQERRRSMPPPRVYRHRGRSSKNRVRPAMVRFLRTSSQDSPQAKSSVGKIGLREVAAYLV